jgi:hypothetical protein
VTLLTEYRLSLPGKCISDSIEVGGPKRKNTPYPDHKNPGANGVGNPPCLQDQPKGGFLHPDKAGRIFPPDPLGQRFTLIVVRE